MGYITGLFEGLDERRRQTREEETARQNRLSDLEFNVLSQIAQGPDDELAALASAGLLETLAGNRKVRNAKGLRGFLGEMDRSSFLPTIRQTLQQRGQTPATPAVAGGAALPAGSPVEPSRQGPAAPEMPLVSRQGLGVAPPPEMSSVSQQGFGVAGAPRTDTGELGPATGVSTGPSIPAIPEAPASRFARLYPSAGEVEITNRKRTLMAEYEAKLAAFRAAQTPEERQFMSGVFGSPLPQFRPTAVNVTYVDTQGVERQEPGELQAGGRVMVGGREVRATRVTPITQRDRPPLKVPQLNTQTGTLINRFYDPDTFEVLYEQDSGVPPNIPPQYEGGQVPLAGGGIGMVRRTPTGSPEVVRLPGAEQPPRRGGSTSATTTPEAREAKLFVQQVRERAKVVAGERKNLATGVVPQLKDTELNALANAITNGKYTNWQALLRASSGLPPLPEQENRAAPGSFGTPEGAQKIRDLLNERGKPR